jgi:transposase
VARLVVPDNVLAGIREACYYEPDINPTYQQMADSYGTAILPTRPRKPKDKAKAEVGVQVVQRWVLAKLRNRQFFSLSELNAAIRELITALNDRPFKKLPGSRRSAFETLDRPALRPLPEAPYEYEQWSAARVGLDYHVEVRGHAYSVPYRLVRERVEVRLTASTVEVLHKNKRVASHPRSSALGGRTTVASHQPAAHRAHAELTPERLLAWATEIGPSTLEVVSRMLVEKPHPEHGYRACLGLRKLTRRFTSERLEAACQRTLLINAPTYRSVESILKQGIDRLALPGTSQVETCDLVHENVRGADYYREQTSVEERPC